MRGRTIRNLGITAVLVAALAPLATANSASAKTYKVEYVFHCRDDTRTVRRVSSTLKCPAHFHRVGSTVVKRIPVPTSTTTAPITETTQPPPPATSTTTTTQVSSSPSTPPTTTTTGPLPNDEFSDPSWTQLPTPSLFNATPACPLSSSDNWVCYPDSSILPPVDSNNPETYLNSAYWPAEKRPDIEEYAIQHYGYYYDNCLANLPHYCFLTDAEAAGYPVSHTPVVGDLWVAPGECLAWEDLGGAVDDPSTCSDSDTDWYMGYVEQVFSDGSFIESGGGSDTPADSGLQIAMFSAAMDPYAEFIGLLPPGSPQP